MMMWIGFVVACAFFSAALPSRQRSPSFARLASGCSEPGNSTRGIAILFLGGL